MNLNKLIEDWSTIVANIDTSDDAGTTETSLASDAVVAAILIAGARISDQLTLVDERLSALNASYREANDLDEKRLS